MTKSIYFFIGTTAELIKVLPVMRELAARGQRYDIVASGQNDLSNSELFEHAGLPRPVLVLNRTLKRKTAIGLALWFVTTFFRGLANLPKLFRGLDRASTVLIVHGDTVSTLMGAVLGRILGVRVAHIEAGLRSKNFLQPFPEELDRYLTAFFAHMHFCPYASAVRNLERRGGEKIDTGFNTNIDSLAFARSLGPARVHEDDPPRPYFIFILHRQENLLNNVLVRDLLDVLTELTTRMRCLFVTHELTMTRLRDLGLFERVAGNPNIVLSGRRPYAEFIRLLDGCEFIMTDGGGNQQECYYLGKPCLILRRLTESEEGLGRNVLVSGNDRSTIEDFAAGYESYRHPEVAPARRPSEIIVDTLLRSP